MSEATPNRSANSRLCWCSSHARSSSPNSACIDPRLTSVAQLSCELIASAISKLRSSSSSPLRSPMRARAVPIFVSATACSSSRPSSSAICSACEPTSIACSSCPASIAKREALASTNAFDEEEIDSAFHVFEDALAAAARPPDVGEDDLRFGGRSRIPPRQKIVVRLLENPLVEAGVVAARPAVAKEQHRPPRIVARPKLERSLIKPGRRGNGVQPRRAVARLPEGNARPLLELRPHLSGGASELERAQIVVGEHLGLILASVEGERLEPFGGQPVLLSPGGPRDLRVGDVANERVAERVFLLVGDGRAPFAADEFLPLESVQTLPDAEPVDPAD